MLWCQAMAMLAFLRRFVSHWLLFSLRQCAEKEASPLPIGCTRQLLLQPTNNLPKNWFFLHCRMPPSETEINSPSTWKHLRAGTWWGLCVNSHREPLRAQRDLESKQISCNFIWALYHVSRSNQEGMGLQFAGHAPSFHSLWLCSVVQLKALFCSIQFEVWKGGRQSCLPFTPVRSKQENC